LSGGPRRTRGSRALFPLGVAILAGCAFASPLRRLSSLTRMFVLGLPALPVPVGVGMWTAVAFG